MPRRLPRLPRLAVLAVLLVAAITMTASCTAKRKLTAAETFRAANEHFDDGAYELAIQSYKELLDQDPFTEHAGEAETRIALSYYLMGRYAEAIAAFSDFERMHPTSPHVPLVTYYLGMSYLQQRRPIDRDQTPSANAHAYFRAVMDRYPGSPWADRALLRMRECEEALAEHELYVAAFYLRKKNLSAAEARFRNLLQAYLHTDAAALALDMFGKAYLARELPEPAALSYQTLITHHPEDPLAEHAAAALAQIKWHADPTADADPLQQLLRHLAEQPERPADGGNTPVGDALSSTTHGPRLPGSDGAVDASPETAPY